MNNDKNYSMIAVFASLVLHILLASGILLLADGSPKEKERVVEIKLSMDSFAQKIEPMQERTKEESRVIQKQKQSVVKKEAKAQKQIVDGKEQPILNSILQDKAQAQNKPSESGKAQSEEPKNRNVFSTSPAQKKMEAVGSSNEKEDELKKYFAKIRKKLQENLEYPHFAKKAQMEGVSIVKFRVEADGNIVKSSIAVVKSGGYALLDSQAFQTIIDSSPIEPPPHGSLELSIPISFSLYK